MTYFSDLSVYRYCGGRPIPGVWNVGWLDSQHDFIKGAVPPDIMSKLITLALNKTLNQMRGFHYCQYCSKEDVMIGDGPVVTLLGSAEIWVPTSTGVGYYASPDLIVHYIQDHAYLPPAEHLEALRELSVDAWDPREAEAMVTGPGGSAGGSPALGRGDFSVRNSG
jgi:hypothetical protein